MNLHAESPDDELTGAAVTAALQVAYAQRQSRIIKVETDGVEVSVRGDRVLIVWRFRQRFTFTWSLSLRWALVLQKS